MLVVRLNAGLRTMLPCFNVEIVKILVALSLLAKEKKLPEFDMKTEA